MDSIKKLEMQKDLTNLAQEIHKEVMDFPSRNVEDYIPEMIMEFFNKYNCERIILKDTGDSFRMRF